MQKTVKLTAEYMFMYLDYVRRYFPQMQSKWDVIRPDTVLRLGMIRDDGGRRGDSGVIKKRALFVQ